MFTFSARRFLVLSAVVFCAAALGCSKKDSPAAPASDKPAATEKGAAASPGKVDCNALNTKLITVLKETEEMKPFLQYPDARKMLETAFSDGCKNSPPDPKDAECVMKAKDAKEMSACNGDFFQKWMQAAK
jgi:hypothetical protein